jgi:hypothetical protein
LETTVAPEDELELVVTVVTMLLPLLAFVVKVALELGVTATETATAPPIPVTLELGPGVTVLLVFALLVTELAPPCPPEERGVGSTTTFPPQEAASAIADKKTPRIRTLRGGKFILPSYQEFTAFATGQPSALRRPERPRSSSSASPPAESLSPR